MRRLQGETWSEADGATTVTFYEFSLTRKINDTPVGDLWSDIRSDRDAQCVPNTKNAWKAHLLFARACSGAFEALEEAWRLYEKSPQFDQAGAVGYVYFVQAEKSLFKIGMTTMFPAKRLAQLQTAHPKPLKLYAAIGVSNPKQVERFIHKVLAEYRTRGEWFAVDCETIDEAIELAEDMETDYLISSKWGNR